MSNDSKHPLAYLLKYEADNPQSKYYHDLIPESKEFGYELFRVMSLYYSAFPKKLVDQDTIHSWKVWSPDISEKEYFLAVDYYAGEFIGLKVSDISNLERWDIKIKMRGGKLVECSLPTIADD